MKKKGKKKKKKKKKKKEKGRKIAVDDDGFELGYEDELSEESSEKM